MTSEELRKAMIEPYISQVEVGGEKLTEKEKTVWRDGYYEGCLKGIEYANALFDEKFKITLASKGEGNDNNDK